MQFEQQPMKNTKGTLVVLLGGKKIMKYLNSLIIHNVAK